MSSGAAREVTLSITCRTSSDPSAAGTEHPITLHADGTISTPHDLDAERLAVALGGHLTCVDLVDRTAPVFREWLALRRREVPMPIRSRDQGRRWHARQRGPCCRGGGFETPVAAADHSRSAQHLAAIRGTDPQELRLLVAGARVPEPPRPVGEPWDSLWACGVAPGLVDDIDEQCGVVEPFEPGFYLAVLAHRPDRSWLRRMLEAGPVAPATAEWLAWTFGPADRRHPDRRAEWLQLGIPVRAIVGLMGSGYRPQDVERLAAHWRITHAAAALLLHEWMSQGLDVPVSALTGPATRELAYPPRPPGRNNVAALRSGLAGSTAGSDSDLALAIIEHGSVRAALGALTTGA